jgi:integrase
MLPVPKTPPVFVSDELIRTVDAALEQLERERRVRDRKMRARFRVLAATGKRPSELMRAEPQDVDLARRVWIVRDGKGGFSPGLYLNDDMLAAWQFFIDAEAWGPFRGWSYIRTLRMAGWPEHVRPYNLRHTTWITASERGIDLADIQAGAGHKSIATTRRHYVPVRDSRMQKMSEALAGRFGWVPAGVPADAKTPAENPRKTKNRAAGSRAGRNR